jgi:hypothetical protein
LLWPAGFLGCEVEATACLARRSASGSSSLSESSLDDELLLPDSRRLQACLQAAGVNSRLQEFPRRWHVFQANAGVLADADRALEAVGRFLRGNPGAR